MIKSFKHKGLEKFFNTQSKSGIQPHHAKRLAVQLGTLDVILTIDEMDIPGWLLHRLQGELKDHWAVNVDGNWRLTFRFEGSDVFVIDYQDYH